jgi:hypothetical protein
LPGIVATDPAGPQQLALIIGQHYSHIRPKTV